MWYGAGIFRTEAGLAEALAGVGALKNERLLALTGRNLLECCTAANMVLVGSLMSRAALSPARVPRGAYAPRSPSCERRLPPERSPSGHTFLSLTREGIEEAAR